MNTIIMERRGFNRTAVKIRVHCVKNWFDGRREVFFSMAKNLSDQGVLILTSKEVVPGEHIILVLHIPGYYFPVLLCGEVVWLKRENKERKESQHLILAAGIKFFKIDKSDQNRIRNFLGQHYSVI